MRQQRVGGQVVYSLVGAEVAQLLVSARRLLRELLDEGRAITESLETVEDTP
ncbi:MAG: hypothetical protein ABR500_11890 [Dermatophilaceae bacterium]